MLPLRRLQPTLALAAIALLTAAALGGCAGTANNRSGGGAAATISAGTPSGSGFDGGLLPANLKPRQFSLIDQRRRPISLRQFRGQVVILAFLYSTSKTTAPLIAQQLRGALDELGPSVPAVPVLAVSVDPTADTPAHVNAFLRKTSLTGRMEYLTGTPAQLGAVWRAYSVTPASAGPRAYERGAFVLLLDKAGAERVDFSLEVLTPEALAHDIRRLARE